MTDREKLLTALLQESDRNVISLVDVVTMLEQLGAEYRQAESRGEVLAFTA